MEYINKLFNLKNKVVAITGAAGFLCSEMAQGLSEAGCAVVLMDVNKKGVERVARGINQNGSHARALAIDVTKRGKIEDCLSLVLEEFGRVDVLINGAGINAPTPFLEITGDEWEKILAVNLKGMLFSCQVFGQQMLEQDRGSIINISSASAGPPLSKAFTYSVAKAGVKNITQNLAREWGTQGVRVNTLRPGFFPTDWNRKNFIDPKREQAILGHTPMKRFGKPNELLGAVLWLASDASSFVTGAEITVDGGFACMTI